MSATPRRQVSTERKALYYVGMALVVVGLGLFVSTFFAAHSAIFGSSVESALARVPELQRNVLDPTRPLGGMALMVIGGLLMNLGRRGPAGAGLILDPERARRDLEPLSRMGGGMLKDALDEANVDLGQDRRTPREVVKLRCRACGALDDETAKFCSACGKPM